MNMQAFAVVTFLSLALFTVPAHPRSAADSPVSGPRGAHPYLFGGYAKKSLAPAIGNNTWSIMTHRRTDPAPDTLRIVAFMVEFNGGRPDSSELTTGNGLFGIFNWEGGTRSDQEEIGYYNSDTVYRYDNLPHRQPYFAAQLEYVKNYFHTASRGRLVVEYDIYPKTEGAAYAVDSTMVTYSPASKRDRETWDEYYYRKTRGLMRFVKEAVQAANRDDALGSPFASYDPSADGDRRKTAFLIIHAGSSYLTDGGADGAFGRDTPSDMIDAFIDDEFFRYFRDTLDMDTLGGRAGVRVSVAGNTPHLVSEIMMVSETSNQDGLNWGIHGILVNQVARQLGIPDLFSTSSGVSGIGAFCIMDFAGYSAAQGFIPPMPSAWVRAFMGWDVPVVATAGTGSGSWHVRDIGTADTNGTDTTILLVPINDHEYYLIENRQRNPKGKTGVFDYDTTEDDKPYIAPYPYNVELKGDANIVAVSGDESNTIQGVYNYDIGLPASGVLVWHVDEEVLRQRLVHNLVNADSLYRGVSLVEADGINDLGVMFQGAFYQAAFDYGGAEDVFPHTTVKNSGERATVDSLGPYTRPSTKSNDGGHTHLTIAFNRTRRLPGRTEVNAVRDYLVTNYSDSIFQVSVRWDFLAPGWPKRMAPAAFFDPVTADLSASHRGDEVVALDDAGRIYVFAAAGGPEGSLGHRTTAFTVRNLRGDTAYALLPDSLTGGIRVAARDTCVFLDSVPGPAAMPTAIGGRVFFPSRDGSLHILESISGDSAVWTAPVRLGSPASSHVCGLADGSWAAGCANGTVVTGTGTQSTGSINLEDNSAVCAIADMPDENGAFVCVQESGRISLCRAGRDSPDLSERIDYGIPPFTLAAGNVDNDADGVGEIVVGDSRQGFWLYNRDLALAFGWDEKPNDWTAAYTLLESADRGAYDRLIRSQQPDSVKKAREKLPVNGSAPSLGDVDGDGTLEIVSGGTNGVYVLNYKGVLVQGWPAYLDNRFWLQRGSVTETPVFGRGPSVQPLILFSSPTGDNVTFTITKIDSTDRNNTRIYYTRDDGTRDSIGDLSADLVDTLLTFSDSLIAPFVLPGGYVDALGPDAKRPDRRIVSLPATGNELVCHWPMTTGAPLTTAPLLCDLDADGGADLAGLSRTGWAYRWELNDAIVSMDTLLWRQAGSDNCRSFSYKKRTNTAAIATQPPVEFYNFPNPTNGSRQAVFRYRFSGRATDVRIDIWTYTGHQVYSWKQPSSESGYNYPGWNEHYLSLDKFGPAVYRCRIEAKVAGKKHSMFWKMAVVK